jgi:hypothetical protein
VCISCLLLVILIRAAGWDGCAYQLRSVQPFFWQSKACSIVVALDNNPVRPLLRSLTDQPAC